MVWAMGFKDGIGYTVGHRELDGNPRKIEYVDTTREFWTVGGGFEVGELHAGRPIKPDFIPTRVARGGKKHGIPDVVWGINMYFVNDRFRAVLEGLEPHVHQYFPVDMLWEDGTLAQKMYMLNICNRLDTVSREASTARLSDSGRMWRAHTGKIVFSLPRIGGHHLWIDKHISKGAFVSDAFHDALLKAGISGLDFSHRPSSELM